MTELEEASTILALEEAAFRAWPALSVLHLDGWELRSTLGITRRANSAWTLRAIGTRSLASRIDATEAFYRRLGRPVYFQVTSRSQPTGLDEALADRGYAVEAPVAIQTASLSALLATTPPAFETEVEPRVGEGFLHVTADHGRFASAKDVFLGILDRIGPRGGFALVRERASGEPIAAGLGVVDGHWIGVFGMQTKPSARRRGAARAVLAALAAWGTGCGATRAYLQVERDNASALALYAQTGFEERYGYHYRVAQ
jgi:GNAT superfamily N-acetyltransferase